MEIKTIHCNSTNLENKWLEKECFNYYKQIKEENEDATLIDCSKAINIARKYIDINLEALVDYYEDVPINFNDQGISTYILLKSIFSAILCIYLPKDKKLEYGFGLYSHLKFFTNLDENSLKFSEIVDVMNTTMKELEKEINDKYQEEK